MEQQLKSILTAVANDTLEKLAFLFAFPDNKRINDSSDPALAGRIDFKGYFDGFLLMRISACVIPELANNMLGLADDAQISRAEQQDALKEMLNVICGNALPAIAGDQVEFNIQTPEILTPTQSVQLSQKGRPACTVRLTLEEGFCDLYFFIQGEFPELTLHNDSEMVE
jgi:chemotaxis protein CheY-P-specific phosphatase CheC